MAATAQAAETKPPAPTAQPATRIETDQKAGIIRFVVNGKEQACIDANGLHVREGIAYNGGTLTDGDALYSANPPATKGKGKP